MSDAPPLISLRHRGELDIDDFSALLDHLVIDVLRYSRLSKLRQGEFQRVAT